jgi:uncharacterized protein YbaP (TraB family)
MKRFLALLGTIFLLAGFTACASSARVNHSVSSVWKISKGGNVLFLGGSIHLLRAQDFPLPKEFDIAFAQSAILALEADVEQAATPEAAAFMLAQMMLPQGKTLESVLAPDVYDLLRAKYEAFGIPIETFSQMKPTMVVTMLEMLQIQESGFIEQGVDMHYLAKAKEEGKALDFLETVEEQLALFAGMGEGYEDDFVRYSIADSENSEKFLVTIVSEWKEGKAAFTESMLAEMQEDWPMVYQPLIAKRNAAWLPRIEAYLTGKPVEFVIVGLAHLHGNQGLLRLLADSGYTVEQLAATPK